MSAAAAKKDTLDALRTGATLEAALAYAKTTPAQWERWVKSKAFQAEVEKIDATHKMMVAGTLRKAEREDLAYAERASRRQAAEAHLERLRDISGACR